MTAKKTYQKNDRKFDFELDLDSEMLYTDVMVKARERAAEPRQVIRTADIWGDVADWCGEKKIDLVECSRPATINNDSNVTNSARWIFKIKFQKPKRLPLTSSAAEAPPGPKGSVKKGSRKSKTRVVDALDTEQL